MNDASEEEMVSLERETELLEKQLHSLLSSDLQKMLCLSVQGNKNLSCVDTTLLDELDHLQVKLDGCKALTDVNILEVCSQQQENERHLSLQPEYLEQLRGDILGVEFELQYLRCQRNAGSSEGDTKSVPYVNDLQIKVKEPVPEHIADYLKRCEENGCIKDFFMGFVRYRKWCNLRQKTFNHFKEKYPDLVSLTTFKDEIMLQISTKNERYTVKWDNLVCNNMTVYPSVDLYIDEPFSGDDATPNALSEQFQLIVQKHGIETALDTILQLISGVD